MLFASRGANVVVNDFNSEAAQKVVDEIKKGALVHSLVPARRCDIVLDLAGGSAIANTSSVTDGAAVIQSAISAFGGVSILINNAGILRDRGLVMFWKVVWKC